MIWLNLSYAHISFTLVRSLGLKGLPIVRDMKVVRWNVPKPPIQETLAHTDVDPMSLWTVWLAAWSSHIGSGLRELPNAFTWINSLKLSWHSVLYGFGSEGGPLGTRYDLQDPVDNLQESVIIPRNRLSPPGTSYNLQEPIITSRNRLKPPGTGS